MTIARGGAREGSRRMYGVTTAQLRRACGRPQLRAGASVRHKRGRRNASLDVSLKRCAPMQHSRKMLAGGAHYHYPWRAHAGKQSQYAPE